MPRKQQPSNNTSRRGFGYHGVLPSGNIRAYYKYQGETYKPPKPFESEADAIGWLDNEEDMIDAGTWVPPTQRTFIAAGAHTLLRDYATDWIENRRNKKGEPLAPRTVQEYRSMLRDHIVPTLGDYPLRALTVPVVGHWHDNLLPDHGRRRNAVYALLSSILTTARKRTLISMNPCENLEHTARPDRTHVVKIATIDQLDLIAAALPERYRALFLISAWCDTRWGELVELRRKDLDLKEGTLDILRAMGVVNGVTVIARPKGGTKHSTRNITIPPHIRPAIAAHVLAYAQPGEDGLLFPPALGGDKHLAHGTFTEPWGKARKAAGRPDLHFHDLRHTASSLLHAVGGGVADIMYRNGQATADMALLYTHEQADADEMLANGMSDLYLAVKAGKIPPRLRKSGLV